MNTQQAGHPKSSANGFGRRRGEKEGGARVENKSQSGKANQNKLTSNKSGNSESPSRDRLVYLTTCLIGQQVEVQVKNGSVYSGIFHATNAEKDFGIILKMSRMIKDGTLRGQKAMAESVSKPPSKTFIIPGKELVQVIAKDVSITRDGLLNEVQHDKPQELMLDSVISQSRRGEMERELEPWVPDEDDPRCPELENIFDGHWNRSWDQFETNETLFGVKSTFDEDLYTTKLERGPKTRELEREALRIAREIEGEDTHDLHSAEERGIHLHGNFDIDEETRYSSVYRGTVVDDSGYDEDEDILLDTHNTETFGDSPGSLIKSSIDWTSGKANNGTQDYTQFSESTAAPDLYRSGSYDHARQLASEPPFKSFPSTAGESSEHGDRGNGTESVEKHMLAKDTQTSKPDDSHPSLNGKKDALDKGELSSNATSYAPADTSSKGDEKTSTTELLEGRVTGKAHAPTLTVNTHGRPSSSASSNSERTGAAPRSGGPGLSPSSSLGSLSSEKSTLNPNAKEFKLNPNAKSFVPSSPVRPPSPVSDGSFYYPSNGPAVPHMPGMPVGLGVGPSFPHQPVMFSPQHMQTPQAYFHQNGPQYGQQMLLGGHPRQVLYMPSYQPEMPYKGRDY